MTSHYLTNITPDSFSGLIFGFEGVENTIVLMNGPTGCKFYHSATSDNQALRQLEFDPLRYPELWYFGQPRVPCTYLDKNDYVYGSEEKLTEAMRFLKSRLSFRLLVIVNSPGAALIGDDLERIAQAEMGDISVITVESPGYSHFIWEGYSQACVRLIRKFCTAPAVKSVRQKKRVNLLGFSIFQKYYEGDIAELRRLLELCGIEVGCCLCCGCSLEEIQALGDAELNLVLDPLYGQESAELLKEMYGTPYRISEGMPVGFSAAETWIQEICRLLGCDCGAFTVESEKARARAYIYLSRLNSLTGLPKGAKFAVQGTSSQCLGYARFLIRYFGMAADSILILDGDSDREPLLELLKQYHMEGALERDILYTEASLVFADGNILAKLKARRHEFSGIEIGLPSLGYTDVIPKTHLALSGGLLLCEQIINGLIY